MQETHPVLHEISELGNMGKKPKLPWEHTNCFQMEDATVVGLNHDSQSFLFSAKICVRLQWKGNIFAFKDYESKRHGKWLFLIFHTMNCQKEAANVCSICSFLLTSALRQRKGRARQ